MKIKPLRSVGMSEMTKCFNLAFSDYILKFEATETYLKKRWKAARVDEDLSFVFFDKGQPVGFIIICIDIENGIKTAFNAGTGVIPSYRGQKIVDHLYEHALPFFHKEGVGLCSLEVISTNPKAIRVYERIGFHVSNALPCYRLEKTIVKSEDFAFQVKQVEKSRTAAYESFWAYTPSWECNSKAVNLRDDVEIWEISDGYDLIAYFILSVSNNQLLQFAVKPDQRKKGIGKWMFKLIGSKINPISILNVDECNSATNLFLIQLGFKNHISQYEMRMKIFQQSSKTNSLEQALELV